MPNTSLKNSEGFYGWVNALILFFLYGTIYGFIFYGFTVVFPAMINAEGWGRGEAALAHTIRGFLLGLLAPLVSYSVVRFGAKRTIIAGLAIGTVVMMMLGGGTSQLWHWIVLWGVIMPISFSMAGVIPLQTTVTYWFNIRRATVMGVVLTGAAVAGFISAPLFTFIMEKAGTWKAGWITAGIFCALAMVSSFFIKNKPEDIGQFPDGINPDNTFEDALSKKLKMPKTYRTTEPWALKEAVKIPALYLLTFCMIAQASALYLLTVHGVLHFTDLGCTKMQAASVIGNLILFSGLARIPMGVLGDRIEPRWIVTVALAGMGITLLGFWKAPNNMTILLSMSAVYGLCFGATVPMFPTIIGNYFSPSSFASINGFMQPFIIIAGAPVPLVSGMIYDKFNNYNIAFIYAIILIFLATICASLLAPPKRN